MATVNWLPPRRVDQHEIAVAESRQRARALSHRRASSESDDVCVYIEWATAPAICVAGYQGDTQMITHRKPGCEFGKVRRFSYTRRAYKPLSVGCFPMLRCRPLQLCRLQISSSALRQNLWITGRSGLHSAPLPSRSAAISLDSPVARNADTAPDIPAQTGFRRFHDKHLKHIADIRHLHWSCSTTCGSVYADRL